MMLHKLSDWYDSLHEPYRFFTFIYFVFGAFFPFAMAMFTFDAKIIFWPYVFATLGMLHLAFFYSFAIYRATRK